MAVKFPSLGVFIPAAMHVECLQTIFSWIALTKYGNQLA